jgi:hypothetical protein
MCEPATIIMTGLAVASATVGYIGQKESGKAQVRAINEQNELQAQEIADAAGVKMTESARAARRERAAMRASGAESGINLGSNSFLDALQTSVINQYNDQGLILRNESNSQRARDAQARSLASQVRIPSGLEGALSIGAAGAGTYYGMTRSATNAASTAAAKA